MTTDRDPKDASALGAAVAAYILDARSVGAWSRADARDIAFEAVLLEQGVISPDDGIESIDILLGSKIAGDYICVCLDDGAELSLHRDGRVNCC